MAITASAGNVSANINARRPSWADMVKHYPAAEVDIDVLYNSMIRGAFKGMQEHPGYVNTCATRMSYALNRSGIKLGKTADPNGTVEGGDGYNYWIRVEDVKAELISRFKGFDEELVLEAIPNALVDDEEARTKLFRERVATAQHFLDTRVAGKRGIVVFETRGIGDATGHFTLWDGPNKKLAYAGDHGSSDNRFYYFWYADVRKNEQTGRRFFVQTVKVKFWELK